MLLISLLDAVRILGLQLHGKCICWGCCIFVKQNLKSKQNVSLRATIELLLFHFHQKHAARKSAFFAQFHVVSQKQRETQQKKLQGNVF